MIRWFIPPILLSAALLFSVQPLFARLALPLLGGTPAVWNTAMLFFQSALLLGYAYAHGLATRMPLRRQVIVHGLVIGLAALAMPIALPDDWSPPAGQAHVWWLLGLMTVSVGVPFFAVSTTSPLLQRWFAETGDPAARDPYFLYAASNVGSLGSLLAYPLLIEPHLPLARQSAWWAWGYILLIGTVILAGWQATRAAKGTAAAVTKSPAADEPVVTRSQWLRWIAYAAIPSSLMLSTTQYLTTDIASMPLLWLPPLGLYLLSFINAFAKRPWIGDRTLARAVPLAGVVLALLLAARATEPTGLILIVHLTAFFLLACLCHGRLAAERPPAASLTSFYLALSIGGVVGGAFTALVAPLVFTTVLEYPIGLIAALFLTPRRDPSSATGAPVGRKHWLVPAAAAVLAAGAFWLGEKWPDFPVTVLLMPATLACYGASLISPRLFTAGVALFLATALSAKRFADHTLDTERSFFGIYRVQMDDEGRSIQLMHGTTLHGSQVLDPAARRQPTTYFSRGGPCGEIIDALQSIRPLARVGVIGLGVGTLAAYGTEGSQWDFFEIDPSSVHFARDSGHFTYLKDSQATCRIILGDGRLKLAEEADGQYDLLIVDAFSSDAIPLHLATREAMALYFQKLKPDGRLLFHISNRHFDLRPAIAALADSLGVACRTRHRVVENHDPASVEGMSSLWALLAREESQILPLIASGTWEKPAIPSGFRVWTDDYASLLSVLKRDR